jgi:hypothetical protein
VFTSVRPESLNDVDADTRDRWVVTTAEATLERIAVFAEALDSEARGDALATELEARGVSPSLASGVPLAIDHYGATRAYLEAVRQLAVDALEVVAGDRDEARSVDLAPGEGGDATLGPLPELDLVDAPELETPAEVASSDSPTADAPVSEADEPAAATGDATASTETLVDEAATDEPETTAEPGEAVETDSVVDDSGVAAEPAEAAGSTGDSVDNVDSAEERTSEPDTSEPSESSEPADSLGGTADFGGDSTDDTDAGLGDFDSEDDGETGLGDFDSADESDAGVGDFDDGASDAEAATRESGDGMYELPEEERREVEAEFGTEFSTGSEVGPAGEADIDVPSIDELEEELDEDLGSEPGASEVPAATSTAADKPATDVATPETDAAEGTDAEEGTAEATDADTAGAPETADTATDVDLETVAVEAMTALDDGDGAAREAVVARVVDEYGVDPGAVEDAIQSALMSGQCYEPTEDSLKAI